MRKSLIILVLLASCCAAFPVWAQEMAPCPPQRIYEVLGELTWTAAQVPPDVTLTGYVLSRSLNDGPFQPVSDKPLAPDALRYVDGLDTPLVVGSTYRYQLVALYLLPSGHTRMSLPWEATPAHCPAFTIVPLAPPGQLSGKGIVLDDGERTPIAPRKGAKK